MNKIEKIYNLLVECQMGVQEKANRNREILRKPLKKGQHHLHEFCEQAQYTEGQLYELNYIISKFWDIIAQNQ